MKDNLEDKKVAKKTGRGRKKKDQVKEVEKDENDVNEEIVPVVSSTLTPKLKSSNRNSTSKVC